VLASCARAGPCQIRAHSASLRCARMGVPPPRCGEWAFFAMFSGWNACANPTRYRLQLRRWVNRIRDLELVRCIVTEAVDLIVAALRAV
jgi:hypothetical protein